MEMQNILLISISFC